MANLAKAAKAFEDNPESNLPTLEQAVGALKQVAAPALKAQLEPVEAAILQLKQGPSKIVGKSAEPAIPVTSAQQALKDALDNVLKNRW